MNPAMIMKMPLVQRVAAWAVLMESWYFDKRHHVETHASREEQTAGMADVSAGFWYLPTRPATVHMLLKELPMDNLSDYTFVDIGSGKGRVLLIAAQYGFRRVVGVEFRRELHERALQNVQSWRGSKAQRARLVASKAASSDIECLNMNARDYIFPDEKLVLYFFNPFGDEIMKEVLSHLDESLELYPRDVLVSLVYPEHASAVDAVPRLELYKELRRCRIYRSTFSRSARTL